MQYGDLQRRQMDNTRYKFTGKVLTKRFGKQRFTDQVTFVCRAEVLSLEWIKVHGLNGNTSL